jgi:hypothetical protein
MRRTSVTLTEAQERAIGEFSQPGPYRDELTAWARSHDIELGDSFSEATLVRLLIDAGIEHVRTRSVDVVYTELAGIYVDEGLSHEITALRSEALTAEQQTARSGEPRGRHRDPGGGAASGGAGGGRAGALR